MNQISIYDIYPSQWPFYDLTFKCDLDLQGAQTNKPNGTSTPQREQLCHIIWNPCINVQVMARTSSTYEHFITWPSSVTLTFNLPEQMFQIALLLPRENNCVQLFWNPSTNVQVMARTNPERGMHIQCMHKRTHIHRTEVVTLCLPHRKRAGQKPNEGINPH